jgi:hypothetical protein
MTASFASSLMKGHGLQVLRGMGWGKGRSEFPRLRVGLARRCVRRAKHGAGEDDYMHGTSCAGTIEER